MFVGKARVSDGLRLYAVGDVHGCIDPLKSLFDQIREDLVEWPVTGYRIITLGDLVDRGPNSKAVLEYLIEARTYHPMVCLRGNHDQRMLEFLDVPEEVGEAFLVYGGREFLQSYGIEGMDEKDVRQLSHEFRAIVPSAHVKFLDSLSLFHEEGDYAFVHAGIKPGIPMAMQSPDHLLWIRNEFLIHHGSFGAVVVHGHTPGDFVDIRPNRINLDTYCFDSGILSCAVLEGSDIRLLQTQARRR